VNENGDGTAKTAVPFSVMSCERSRSNLRIHPSCPTRCIIISRWLLYWGHLLAQLSPQPDRPPPRRGHAEEKDKPSLPLSHYISWSDLLRKTFAIDTICPRCKSPLRLIALIETRTRYEDPVRHGSTHRGRPQTLARPTASVQIWTARW